MGPLITFWFIISLWTDALASLVKLMIENQIRGPLIGDPCES